MGSGVLTQCSPLVVFLVRSIHRAQVELRYLVKPVSQNECARFARPGQPGHGMHHHLCSPARSLLGNIKSRWGHWPLAKNMDLTTRTSQSTEVLSQGDANGGARCIPTDRYVYLINGSDVQSAIKLNQSLFRALIIRMGRGDIFAVATCQVERILDNH